MESLEKPRHMRYYHSIDIARLLMMLCIIIAYFGLPFEKSDMVQPIFHFATGTMYTFYGYLVLRDGRDLRKNIKRCFVAFALMFVIYGVLAMGYDYYMYGDAFGYFDKRSIFNFIVLNYWGSDMGSAIWMVQAALYALVIFYIFRGLKRFDWLFCILLFAVAILLGEFATLINFNFLGYRYIAGNFLTRAMPYMLLGRLIHKRRRHFEDIKRSPIFVFMFVLGAVMSLGELLGLNYLGVLVYYNHLIGFIPMAWAICAWTAGNPHKGHMEEFMTKKGSKLYKIVYFIFNPIGVVCTTYFYDSTDSGAVGLLTISIALLIAFIIALPGTEIVSKTIYRIKRRRQSRYIR